MSLRQTLSIPPIIAPLLLLLMIGVRNNTGGKSTKLDLAEGWGRGERWKVYGKWKVPLRNLRYRQRATHVCTHVCLPTP